MTRRARGGLSGTLAARSNVTARGISEACLLPPFLSACAAAQPAPTPGRREIPRLGPHPGRYLQLAGELDSQFRESLRLWFPRCVDKEAGGFLEHFGADWFPQARVGEVPRVSSPHDLGGCRGLGPRPRAARGVPGLRAPRRQVLERGDARQGARRRALPPRAGREARSAALGGKARVRPFLRHLCGPRPLTRGPGTPEPSPSPGTPLPGSRPMPTTRRTAATSSRSPARASLDSRAASARWMASARSWASSP